MRKLNLNPGSTEAIDAGCTCPVLDNAHGRGYYGNPNAFIYTDSCPVHGYMVVAERFPSVAAPNATDTEE